MVCLCAQGYLGRPVGAAPPHASCGMPPPLAPHTRHQMAFSCLASSTNMLVSGGTRHTSLALNSQSLPVIIVCRILQDVFWPLQSMRAYCSTWGSPSAEPLPHAVTLPDRFTLLTDCPLKKSPQKFFLCGDTYSMWDEVRQQLCSMQLPALTATETIIQVNCLLADCLSCQMLGEWSRPEQGQCGGAAATRTLVIKSK